MKPVRIRTLQSTDAEALLAFELDNREWFERHIDARGSAFYSMQGVTDHIDAYLADFAAGTWHPFVIEDDAGNIVGRANLKGIDMTERSAEVGYRIAQNACGQGLATLAVRHLIQQAQLHWNLKQLVATVYAENIGSAKVLERCGFLIEHVYREGAEHECRFGLSI
ncbi:ribosomal-protein-alanine N-acetyltransferase [Pseudomonas sp. PvR086]|jgi:ribosomal-protein-alanine N-acetyltransferase|uniref:GNAT family N-acetyltransferase n=1 Tax=Pseudomonas TaxID=286 RepID=UPI000B358130|nr:MULTISPECIES: GNAT family N-acetyltransferase [Pseudomonas]MBD9607901.1 GNAT family N-acetyltransferase [Pseudomonas sp. PDM08]MDR7106003.1 ribosomal-protein-alanine N-acetyltransferase [Pseudomonas frederiksbergensis]PMY47295.1 N-acetyltransferase [Pseudomonas sp. FW305-53]PMY84033.1 N-acetyltransferase [Pseudomonas sp. FW303-C2]PMY90078.1 N-acetyltransferase [Pseudomonas sp. FW305-62]